MKKSYYLGAALILLSIWLQACATTVEPLCRHRALYQAISFHDLTGAPVRIAVGPSDEGLHAQAQGRVNGKWEWLEQGDFGVGTGYMDTVPGFTPTRYDTVEEFLMHFGYQVITRVNVAEKGGSDFHWTSGDYSSSRSIYRSPF